MPTLQKLNEAVDAYHRLNIGGLAYKVVIDGEVAEFNQPNDQRLRKYIAVLAASLGVPDPLATPSPINAFEILSHPNKGY